MFRELFRSLCKLVTRRRRSGTTGAPAFSSRSCFIRYVRVASRSGGLSFEIRRLLSGDVDVKIEKEKIESPGSEFSNHAHEKFN